MQIWRLAQMWEVCTYLYPRLATNVCVERGKGNTFTQDKLACLAYSQWFSLGTMHVQFYTCLSLSMYLSIYQYILTSGNMVDAHYFLDDWLNRSCFICLLYPCNTDFLFAELITITQILVQCFNTLERANFQKWT